MVRWLLLLGLALTGCDALFGLDSIRPPDTANHDAHLFEDAPLRPGDAVVDGTNCMTDGHDEDGDGIVDACDACPTVTNSGFDTDGDGLDDQCDPDLALMKNDKILFAVMFADSAEIGDNFNQTTASWELGTDGKGQATLFGNSVLTTKQSYAPTKIEVRTAGVGVGFGAEANVMHSGSTCQVLGSDCAKTTLAVACLHAYPGSATGTLPASSANVKRIDMFGPDAITCTITDNPTSTSWAMASTTTLLDDTTLQFTTSVNGSIIIQSIVIYGQGP